MNQTFNTSRWWLLVSKHWAENKRKYTLSLIAIAGLLLFWFIVMAISDGFRGLNVSMQTTTYYFGLFLSGCLYGSILFADLGSKTKGLNYLTVPASHLEKLLCSLFYSVIVFFLLYTALFYLVDILVVKAANAIEYSYWIKHHAAGNTFEPQEIYNVFYQPEHTRSNEDLIYILLGYFVVQSVFILGSVYFARFSFIKTVIASLVIGLLMVFIVVKVIVPILPAGNYYKGLTSYQVYTTKSTPAADGIMIYSDLETDKLVTIPAWMGDVFLFILKYAFAPLFWLVTYYRLKEKEI